MRGSTLNHTYAADAFYLYYSENNIISGNTINVTKQHGLVLNRASHNLISHNKFINTTSMSIKFGGTDDDYNVVAGNYVLDSHDYGIDVNYGTYNSILDNHVIASYYSGIALRGGSNNNTVRGNTVLNSDQSGTGHAGISVLDTNYNIIEQNLFSDDQTPKTQDKGVSETGTSDHNIIVDNYVEGNAVASITITGSNTVVERNVGFVTENSGTASNCINGTWVSHGLAGMPTLVELTINGSKYVNSTCCLIEPSMIASNSTHFQVEFLMNNNGTITGVASANQKDIMWYVEYHP